MSNLWANITSTILTKLLYKHGSVQGHQQVAAITHIRYYSILTTAKKREINSLTYCIIILTSTSDHTQIRRLSKNHTQPTRFSVYRRCTSRPTGEPSSDQQPNISPFKIYRHLNHNSDTPSCIQHQYIGHRHIMALWYVHTSHP